MAITERRWPRRRPEQLLGEERIAVGPAVNVEQFVRRGMAEDRLELRRLLARSNRARSSRSTASCRSNPPTTAGVGGGGGARPSGRSRRGEAARRAGSGRGTPADRGSSDRPSGRLRRRGRRAAAGRDARRTRTASNVRAWSHSGRRIETGGGCDAGAISGRRWPRASLVGPSRTSATSSSPAVRSSPRRASTIGPKGSGVSPRSIAPPSSTNPPAALAARVAWATSRLLPTPASPASSMSEGRPPEAAANVAASRSSSVWRPMNSGLERRPAISMIIGFQSTGRRTDRPPQW